jgi:hypothetical protein
VSTLGARREFTDRLLAKLGAEPHERPAAGDFAAVCTDLHADTWELFPVALTMTDGTILQLRGPGGCLLAFSSIAERDQAIVTPARLFPYPLAVEALCWLPFNGLGALRVHLAKLKGSEP